MNEQLEQCADDLQAVASWLDSLIHSAAIRATGTQRTVIPDYAERVRRVAGDLLALRTDSEESHESWK